MFGNISWCIKNVGSTGWIKYYIFNLIESNTNASTENAPIPVEDPIEKAIGKMEKYQIFICAIIMLSKPAIAVHQMGIIFLAPPVSYFCKDDQQNNSCPCNNPEYDTSVFESTIVTEWDLICDRKWLAAFSQMLFMLGTLMGSMIFGSLSDSFGRRVPMLIAVIIQVLAGMIATICPEYWSFSIMRLIVGVTVGGTMVVGFVIAVEYIGKEYREIISCIYQIPFNFGHTSLPVFGYFFRNWYSFQRAISCTSVILIMYICLLPESPRWLLATGQTEKAIKIIERNNLPTETIASDINSYQSTRTASQLKKGTTADLFRTPIMRKNTICMTLNWFVCGYCFYGVSQYIGNIAGNIFINVALGGLVTIPCTILSIPIMARVGRKKFTITTLILTSVCLFTIAIIPSGHVATVVFACLGEGFIFMSFIMVYLYSSELFPTVVRNAGIGLSSMIARIGSMIAPFVAGMQNIAFWLPPVLFGIVPLICVITCSMLPETKGRRLLNTVEEGENYDKNPSTM